MISHGRADTKRVSNLGGILRRRTDPAQTVSRRFRPDGGARAGVSSAVRERAAVRAAARHRDRRRGRVARDRRLLASSRSPTSSARRCSSTTRRTCAPAAARRSTAFGEGRVIYATKAFLCRAMARLAHEEGLLLDVASGGELHVALSAGVPAAACTFHGNNKSVDELRTAITAGVRNVVVDSFDELDRLDVLHAEGAPTPGRPAADHARRPRPHPPLRRHRPGRLQVRVQPQQRRRRRERSTGPGARRR